MKTQAFAVATALIAATSYAQQVACPIERIEIETKAGVSAFSVEIADRPELRERGLMFRTDLPHDTGMLFVFDEISETTFWMKNTPLSLDMLFISSNGRICGLIERATPYSLDPRPSGCLTRAVLEINGGLAKELGLHIGNRTRHAAFGMAAAWPCDQSSPPAG